MKKINYYSGIFSLAFIFFFASCSTTKYGAHFQPSNHSPSNYTKSENGDAPALAMEEAQSESAKEKVEERTGAGEISTDALPKAVTLKKLITEVKAVDENEFTERQQQILAETRERLQNMSRKEKRQLRREVRKLSLADYTKDMPVYENMGVNQDVRGGVNVLALIFAILIPPLGVFINQGAIDSKFWISLVLTILFFVPGMVYSILVVLGVV